MALAPILNAADLRDMRRTLTESLPDSCQIQRYVEVPDSYGTRTKTWTVHATVPARVQPSAYLPNEREAAGRTIATNRWTITLPALTDVKETDRLVIGSRTFEVIAVYNREGMEISRRCSCEVRA